MLNELVSIAGLALQKRSVKAVKLPDISIEVLPKPSDKDDSLGRGVKRSDNNEQMTRGQLCLGCCLEGGESCMKKLCEARGDKEQVDNGEN